MQLSDLVIKILGIAGVTEAEAQQTLDTILARYPDVKNAVGRFQDYAYMKLQELLDVDTAIGLTKKIGSELASGHPSYDPDHWVIP